MSARWGNDGEAATGMDVEQDGECYLDPKTELHPKMGPVNIEVSRRDDGFYVAVQPHMR